MKKKWLILLATCVLALLATWLWVRDNTPVYEGKHAREWFHQYVASGSNGIYDETDHLEAKIALRRLGRDALKVLIDEAAHPRPDTPFAALRHELHRVLFDKHIGPYVKGEQVAVEAEFAIKELQPDADELLPLIQPLLARPAQSQEYAIALWCLGCVGAGSEQGIPHLVAALDSTNKYIPEMAAQSLMFLGAKAKPALPAILKHLNEPDLFNTVHTALANIGPDAKAALPHLEPILISPDPTSKYAGLCSDQIAAALAVFAIDPTRTNALDLIRAGFTEQAGHFEQQALWAAKELGPRAKPLVPQMMAMAADSTNQSRAMFAIDALRVVSPQDLIHVLRDRIKSVPTMNDRIWAAGLILRTDPNDEVALTFLTQQIENASTSPQSLTYALEQLGDASPDNKTIVALLEKQAALPDLSISIKAKQALKKMRLKPLDSGNPK